MNLYDKTLSDTDSIYCREVTNSHQTSIFITQTNSKAAYYLFGNSYTSNTDVVLELSCVNLLFNALSHYLGADSYFKRSSSVRWELNKQWLLERKTALDSVFNAEHARFHVQVNKETTRTYLRGITSMLLEGSTSTLDLRYYIFSGDTIRFVRQNDGAIRMVILGCGGYDAFDSTEESRKKEFYDWLMLKKLTPDYADDLVNSYLVCLSDELKMPPAKTAWHGLREYLYGEKPGKSVYAVADSHELIQYYGEIDRLFAKEADSGPLDSNRFKECRAWADSKDNNRAIRAAWCQYKDFMKWKDAQTAIEELPKNVDLLSTALILFAEKRTDSGEDGWFEEGRSTNGRIREYFEPLTKDKLAAFSEEELAELFCGTKDADGKVVLATMWSGKNGQGWSHIKPKNEKDMATVRDFLVELKSEVGIGAKFLQKDFKHPSGFGPSVISELLMKFHPDQFIKHGEKSHNALAWLGLINFAWNSAFSGDDYKQVCGAAAMILARMKAMDMPRQINADGTPDTRPPDYLTINEFLYFVDTNLDKLKEKVMQMAMKSADYSTSNNQPTAKKPKVDLMNAEDVILLRLAAALRTKPFAILAGHSGTGKSRMVRQLAYMTVAAGNHKVLFEDAEGNPLKTPGNFCMVQVKPNWHDSTDLLGYYSELKGGFRGTEFVKFICKAYAYPDVPFFVCLDEMNLAPVEQYFGEYLSAIESRKIEDVIILDEGGVEKTIKSVITDRLLADEAWRTKEGIQDFSGLGCEFTQSQNWLEKYGLTIPRNLFVVGTVNMDETTNQFSRKVLDRAFTLEMTDADFEHFGDKNPEPSFKDFAGDNFAEALLSGDVVAKKPAADAPHEEKNAFDAQIKNLVALKPVLDGTSFVVAYRFANEYMLYASALNEMRKVIEVSGGTTETLSSGEEGTVEAAVPTPKVPTPKEPEPFDDMILMKVLPRISGEMEMVMRIFAGDPGTRLDNPQGGLAKLLGEQSASFEKMKEIEKRGKASGTGTLTFWP